MTVYQVYYARRPTYVASGQLAAGHQFFHRVGGQRIRAGQVNHGNVLAANGNVAFFSINRNTGIVAHMLARASVAIENCCLAAVRIASKSYPQLFIAL